MEDASSCPASLAKSDFTHPVACPRHGDRLTFRLRDIAEHLDQAETLAHELHVFAEPSEPAEIGSMRIAPIGQTPVAFALIVREAGIDIVEAPIRHLGRFDHATWLATTIAYDPALTGCRGVWLVLRAAGCGLDARDHELEQLIGERGIVAERETAKVLVPSGDRLGHGLAGPYSQQRFGDKCGQRTSSGPARKCCMGDKRPISEPARLIEVRLVGRGGLDLLTLSFVAPDPTRTFDALDFRAKIVYGRREPWGEIGNEAATVHRWIGKYHCM